MVGGQRGADGCAVTDAEPGEYGVYSVWEFNQRDGQLHVRGWDGVDTGGAYAGVQPKLSDSVCDGQLHGTGRGNGEDADVEPDGVRTGFDAGRGGDAGDAFQQRLPIRGGPATLQREHVRARRRAASLQLHGRSEER